jgi:hypothetical protein
VGTEIIVFFFKSSKNAEGITKLILSAENKYVFPLDVLHKLKLSSYLKVAYLVCSKLPVIPRTFILYPQKFCFASQAMQFGCIENTETRAGHSNSWLESQLLKRQRSGGSQFEASLAKS